MRSVLAAVLVSIPMAATAELEQISSRNLTAMSSVAADANYSPSKATYTGCLEPGDAPGTFTLTRIEHRADPAKREMSAHGPMSAEVSETTSLNVGSTKVGLTGHLGQKVALTGAASDRDKRSVRNTGRAADRPLFSVTTLKVVAASCS
jgi:hypothetical protein